MIIFRDKSNVFFFSLQINANRKLTKVNNQIERRYHSVCVKVIDFAIVILIRASSTNNFQSEQKPSVDKIRIAELNQTERSAKKI